MARDHREKLNDDWMCPNGRVVHAMGRSARPDRIPSRRPASGLAWRRDAFVWGECLEPWCHDRMSVVISDREPGLCSTHESTAT